MWKRANLFLVIGAVLARQALFPIASLAADGGPEGAQAGEHRWVPSLAISGGVSIQDMQGSAEGFIRRNVRLPDRPNPGARPLRDLSEGSDLVVSPFVGGSLEVMTPALPIPTRPRLFLSGEILPTFASNHAVSGSLLLYSR